MPHFTVQKGNFQISIIKFLKIFLVYIHNTNKFKLTLIKHFRKYFCNYPCKITQNKSTRRQNAGESIDLQTQDKSESDEAQSGKNELLDHSETAENNNENIEVEQAEEAIDALNQKGSGCIIL